jgi:hypothetical protein
MTGWRMTVAGLIGAVALAAAAATVLSAGGEGKEPETSQAVPGTAKTTITEPSLAEDGRDDPVADECVPDPGTQVVATGPIDGFPPGEEVNGITIVGSATQVDFRLDAPSNRNLIVFRLIYLEGNLVHGWTEIGFYDNSELGFDPTTQQLTGWFRLNHTVDATAPGSENPQRADVDLVYEPVGGRLSGTVVHPETTFALDLVAEEVARDFFADPSCYSDPVDNPG